MSAQMSLITTPGLDPQPAHTKRGENWGVIWKSDASPRVRPFLWGAAVESSAESALGNVRLSLSADHNGLGLLRDYAGGTFYPVRLDLTLTVVTAGSSSRSSPPPPAAPLLAEQWTLLWKHLTDPLCRIHINDVGFCDSAEAALTKAESLIASDPSFAARSTPGTFYPVWMNRVLEVAEVDSRLIEAGSNAEAGL